MSEVRFFNAIEGMALASVKVVVPYSPTPITTLTLYHGATTDTDTATAYQADWYGLLMYGGEFDFVTGKVTLSYDAEGNPISRTAQGVATPITALTGMNVFWTDAGEIQIGGAENANKHGFTLDGMSSLHYGVGLSGTSVYDAPARKGESISVPGRNGNIWVDDGSFENVLVTYPCWMSQDFDAHVDDFRAYLSRHSDKYYKLTDSYHVNEYRMGRYAGPFTAEPGTRNKSGRMDVTFDCMPQRFLNAGYTWRELEIPDIDPSEAVATIFSEENPTGFPAAPAIMLQLNTAPALLSFSVRNDAKGTYANVVIGGTSSADQPEADVCYYVDLQNFLLREGDTPNDPDWESLPISAKTLNVIFPSWDSSNGQALFLDGTNVVNNRTIPHERLERFSIMTRYWTI